MPYRCSVWLRYFLDKDCSERKAFMDKQDEATFPRWLYLFLIPIVILANSHSSMAPFAAPL